MTLTRRDLFVGLIAAPVVVSVDAPKLPEPPKPSHHGWHHDRMLTPEEAAARDWTTLRAS